MPRVRLGYLAEVRLKIGSLAALLAGLAALAWSAPARAGTYDVTTCSPAGPGGVNHAWSAGPVTRLDHGDPQPNDKASFDITGSCAEGGITVRSGTGTKVATWG